jgi:DnaJ like chaperone protein
MSFIGKILGALFGYLTFGYPGAVIGIIIGHYFDKGFATDFSIGQRSKAAQEAFFKAAFSVMGHVAKSDGRVSEREIQLARMAMQQMRLNEKRTHQAMEEFSQGKDPGFPLNDTLNNLKAVCQFPHLLRLFLELQVQMAYADGQSPSEPVKRLLQRISESLGLGYIDFGHVEAMLYGRWQQSSSGGSGQQYTRPRSSQTPLSEAYSVLGVSQTATDPEVTQAYRRKMNENHPDKLMAKGLPKEMIELATSKTQQIKAAYEQIKTQRGM